MGSTIELEHLNASVSGAISRAEHAEPGTPEAESAYREVSHIEEAIAKLIPPDQVQGAVARVGAITAALSANDWLRAAQLADASARGRRATWSSNSKSSPRMRTRQR
jgi:hypothetical protein